MNGSNIRVQGHLAEDARLYVSPDGQAEVYVCLAQAEPLRGLAAGRYGYGPGHAAQYAATAAARRMRKGAAITVHAEGWKVGSDRIVLVDVSLIDCATARDHTSSEQATTA